MSNKVIPIGYWGRSPEDSNFPWPEENSVDDPGQQRILVKKLKNALDVGFFTSYRGWSTCRLCGKMNGSKELEIIKENVKYVIPIGYIHYLRDHHVKADERLAEILS